MPDQRVKGQETVMSVIVDGQLETRIDSIQSAEVTLRFEKLEEDYLGETTTRYDEIFKGANISIEMHLTNQQAFLLGRAIRDRAKRRAGGASRIDVTATYAFPNGDFPTIAAINVFFEDFPINTGGREEYVSVTLSGSVGDVEFIT